MFPSSLQLTLPRILPPGSYPYVRDTAALWVFCDPAPSKGVTVRVSAENSPLTLGRTLTKTSSLDATVFGKADIFMTESPTLYVSAVSTDMHPAAGTQQYSLTVAIAGQANVVTVPVSVTFTDSPFVHASDASIGFDLPYPPSDMDIESKAEDPAIWFPNSEIPLTFTATSEDWLSITPSTGTGWTVPVVRAEAGNLKPGNYFGFVTITAPGAINSPLKIPANAILYAPQPSVNPGSLIFSQSANGPAPAARVLTVSSPTAASFSASTDSSWLSVEPAQTAIPGTVSVSVKPDGLAPGNYAGRVTIRAEYSLAVSIPVTFVYGSSSDLHVSPDSITLYHWPDMSAVDASDRGTFNITADRSMQWTATKSPETWFSLYNSAGFTPSQLTFTVPSWPAPGAYSGTITLTSPDAANSPQVVKVGAVVLDSAPLTMDPTTLHFRAIGADPEPQTVVVSASSPTSFTVDTTTNVGGQWLIVTPSAAQTPATLTVSVKTAGLGNGSYNGRLRFSIPQPDKPPIVMQMLIYLDYYTR